jgi:lysophospholipase L1-like esterase
METREHGGSRLLNLAILAVSSVFALVIAEVGVRALADMPHPYTTDGSATGEIVYSEFRRSRVNVYVPNRRPEGSFVVKPAANIVHGLSPEITFTVDRFGFRNARPITIEKPAGVVRIMVVGGSTTENNMLDDREVWTELLREGLSRRIPNLEVINTGRSGDTSRDHIALLSQRLVAFEPDAAMFLVGVNDLELQMKPDYSPLRDDARSFVGDDSRIPISLIAKVWAADRSHLARTVVLALRRTLSRDERGNPIEDPTSSWVAMKRQELRALPVRSIDVTRWPAREYEQNLRTLVGVARANGIEPVFITQPAIWGAPPGPWEETLWVHPHPDYRVSPDQLWRVLEGFNDVTRRVAQDQDAALVDLARLLPKTIENFTDDEHFTIAGSRAVADIIRTELDRLRWIDRLEGRATTESD